MIPVTWYLILGAVLFVIGVFGFFIKRNIIALLLSVEIMLNAVNLTFVAFSSESRQISGQIFVFSVLVRPAGDGPTGLGPVRAEPPNGQPSTTRRTTRSSWRAGSERR